MRIEHRQADIDRAQYGRPRGALPPADYALNVTLPGGGSAYTFCMQNEWAGAQAFSSFDTYLAPFVKVDNLTQKEVKQCVQSFVYGVNTPSRWGTQAPFSNITLDWTCPADLADQKAIVGGRETDFTYGECRKEMDMNRIGG